MLSDGGSDGRLCGVIAAGDGSE